MIKEKAACHADTGHHSAEFKKAMKNRLNRIEGQIRGINRMIQEDVYCDDILNQMAAVQNALTSSAEKLLDAHIKSCVVEQILDGRTEVVDELIITIKKLIK